MINVSDDAMPDDMPKNDTIILTNESLTDNMIAQTTENDEKFNKSFRMRCFGPIIKGSLRSSMFTLMSGAIGLAVLSLPSAIANSGLVLGCIFIVFGAFCGYWTLNSLSWGGFLKNCTTYSDLVYKLYGKRAGDTFQCLMVIYLLGVVTNFQITGAKFIENVAEIIGISQKFMDSKYERPLQIIIFNILLFPLASLKDLFFLRYGSMFIIVIIIYVAAVIIAESPLYIDYNLSNGDLQENFLLFNFSWNSFSAFAIALFGYSCHSLIFPIRTELARPKEDRLEKIIKRAVSTEFIVYLCMAVLGYLSVIKNTPPIIVLRASITATDYFMELAGILLIFSPIISIPLRVNPCRLQIYLLTGLQETRKLRLFLSGLILAISGTLAIVFPNIYAALTILAGTGGCLINFTLPGLIYITCRKIWHNQSTFDFKKIIAIIIVICGTIASFTGAAYEFLTSMNIIQKNQSL